MTLWQWVLAGWLRGVFDALWSGNWTFRRQRVTIEELSDVFFSCWLQASLQVTYGHDRREMEREYSAGWLFDGVSESRFNAEMTMILMFGTMWEVGKLPMADRILDSFENKVAACFQSTPEDKQRFLRQARARYAEYGDILLEHDVDVALDRLFVKNLLGREGWRATEHDGKATKEFRYALKVIASFRNYRSELRKVITRVEKGTKIIES